MIRHTNEAMPNIDVFLLLENGTDMEIFSHLGDNIIEDPNSDLDGLCEPEFRRPGVPGILSKTIYALQALEGQYDIFFRTNLSSLIKASAFDDFVQSRDDICYSGAWLWNDALRQDLVHRNRVGPERSIKDLSELDEFIGNTFISGAGFFLNAAEAKSLIEQKERVRFDIPDDVAVGLMFAHHELLPHFATIIEPKIVVEDMLTRIRTNPACQVRLQHFPVEQAEALWHELRDDPVWR